MERSPSPCPRYLISVKTSSVIEKLSLHLPTETAMDFQAFHWPWLFVADCGTWRCGGVGHTRPVLADKPISHSLTTAAFSSRARMRHGHLVKKVITLEFSCGTRARRRWRGCQTRMFLHLSARFPLRRCVLSCCREHSVASLYEPHGPSDIHAHDVLFCHIMC